MDLQPEPLKKEIFDKATLLKITEIHLSFTGGNDEGWVYVNCQQEQGDPAAQQLERLPDFHKFEQEIEEWVWQVYDYSGAGDGTDYGDNIVYKIGEAVEENGTWKIPTTSQDWYHQPEYGEEEGFEMGLQPQEEEA